MNNGKFSPFRHHGTFQGYPNAQTIQSMPTRIRIRQHELPTKSKSKNQTCQLLHQTKLQHWEKHTTKQTGPHK